MNNQELCDLITSTTLDPREIQKTYDAIREFSEDWDERYAKYEYLIISLYNQPVEA